MKLDPEVYRKAAVMLEIPTEEGENPITYSCNTIGRASGWRKNYKCEYENIFRPGNLEEFLSAGGTRGHWNKCHNDSYFTWGDPLGREGRVLALLFMAEMVETQTSRERS